MIVIESVAGGRGLLLEEAMIVVVVGISGNNDAVLLIIPSLLPLPPPLQVSLLQMATFPPT